MKISKPATVFAWLLLLSGCVSGEKYLSEIEQALDGRNTQKLSELCAQGRSGACALAGNKAEPTQIVPILQSVTSPTQTRLVVQVPRRSRPAYFVKTSRFTKRIQKQRYERGFSDHAVDHIDVAGLRSNEAGEFFVIGEDGSLWDQRHFKTLDTAKKKPVIAIVSCMDDALPDVQAKMWPQLLNKKPDVILMIGDNVYADRLPKGWAAAGPEQLWHRYTQTRALLSVFQAVNLTPVLAVWDDHDYGTNDGDRTFAHKEESTKVFHSFFAQAKPTAEFNRGPGVSSWWQAFGLQFVLLDDRSFRSPNGLEIPDQTHFGPEQEALMATQIRESKRPVILVSGDQFFGGYHPFESYEGSHPRSFNEQLAKWRSLKGAPVIFVSGDRHLTEVLEVPKQRLGYTTYELTSSAIHAKVFPDAFERSPSLHQLAGVAGQYNYMFVDVLDSSSRRLRIKVRSFGLDEKLLFSKTLTVKTK